MAQFGNVPAIVIVGRNDKTKQSDVIMQIAERLRRQGHAVYWFESERIKASLRIEASIARVWPRLASAPSSLPRPLRVLRFAAKSALVPLNRRRWDFLQAACMSPPVFAARELNHFLDNLPVNTVHLITHSAGGITATKAAVAKPSPDSKIGRIVCFGYPFRPPDHRPQSYRTKHLASLANPLLIVQGRTDAYGSDPVCFRAFLPSNASIAMLDCNHDYNALPQAEFDRAWTAVAEFLDAADPLAPSE